MSREALMSAEAVADVRAMFEARGVQLRAYELDGDTLRIRVVLPAYVENMQIELAYEAPHVSLPGCSCTACLGELPCDCAWCAKEHARAVAYDAEMREVTL